MDLKVTNFIKKDSPSEANFEYLRNNVAYYSTPNIDDGYCLYIFPIPIEDLGNASLNAQEKPMMLMRYIRKAIDEKTIIKKI